MEEEAAAEMMGCAPGYHEEPREHIASYTRILTMKDVDLVQIYFAKIMEMMGDGLEGLLGLLGFPLHRILSEGYGTPTVNLQCDFLSPSTLGHEVVVRSAIVRVGRTSFTVGHRLERDGELCAVGRFSHVWVALNPQQKAQPVPPWIREAVEPNFLADVAS